MRTAFTPGDIELALEGGSVLVFKHSYRCPASLFAYGEVLRFAEEHPDMPVLLVDVVSTPDLSELVEERLGVRHASPQVILFADGSVWWHASHSGVRATQIEDALRP